MNVSFIHPDALWLLIVLPLVWGVALIAPSPGAAWQRRIALIVRTLMVLALIGALAGAQVVQPPAFTTTIFLLDGSDSVAVSQRVRAEAFIAQALASMPPDDQAGVVVFGREALVERMPSSERTFGAPAVRPCRQCNQYCGCVATRYGAASCRRVSTVGASFRWR
jgi:hypothetical protein